MSATPVLNNQKLTRNVAPVANSVHLPQETCQTHVREVSKSKLLGHHQESSLFRNMVTQNREKYQNEDQMQPKTNHTL